MNKTLKDPRVIATLIMVILPILGFINIKIVIGIIVGIVIITCTILFWYLLVLLIHLIQTLND
jgi:hypothetical protein